MGLWGQLQSKLESSTWISEERAPTSTHCCRPGEQPAVVHGHLLAQGTQVAWEQFLLLQVTSEDEGEQALSPLLVLISLTQNGAWHVGAESGSP